MKKDIYAICGYTHWGKSQTLYKIFNKQGFQPKKSPIKTTKIPNKDFIVINASNEDKPPGEYLTRLREIIKIHNDQNIKIVITISLLSSHDPKRIIDYLNNLNDFNIHYIVLKNSWFKNESITKDDLSELKDQVKNGKIYICPDIISGNSTNFSNRVNNIIKIISK